STVAPELTGSRWSPTRRPKGRSRRVGQRTPARPRPAAPQQNERGGGPPGPGGTRSERRGSGSPCSGPDGRSDRPSQPADPDRLGPTAASSHRARPSDRHLLTSWARLPVLAVV